jgi:uncharacterized protein YjbJ (UPF0337 family)
MRTRCHSRIDATCMQRICGAKSSGPAEPLRRAQQYYGAFHLICTAPCCRDEHDGSTIEESEESMDKNRVEGTKHEIKGGVKEAAGKVTGNHAREAAGNIEKNAGKIQKEIGKANDEARKDQHR